VATSPAAQRDRPGVGDLVEVRTSSDHWNLGIIRSLNYDGHVGLMCVEVGTKFYYTLVSDQQLPGWPQIHGHPWRYQNAQPTNE
jgi:hypothetical protein